MLVAWEEFLKIIKEEAGAQVVETWFKAVILHDWNSATQTAILQAPNQFVISWIQEHYLELLKKHLSRLLNAHAIKIYFINAPTQQDLVPKTFIPASSINHMIPLTSTSPIKEQTPPQTTLPVRSEYGYITPSSKKQKPKEEAQLNPLYTFDTFIVGPSNSLAHAAASAVSKNLGKSYNPLFIYGGTGLGKTHLMHAIGNEVKKNHPDLVIKYETSDHFINEFINCIRFDKNEQFRNKYQKVDLLLLDDIQFLSNKEQTQETFFHIFNALYEKQKQIILSSDTFPKEITGLQSRLKSRMEWGLVADIQLPDLETKIAILDKKAHMASITLPNDVAHFIASRVISNIRELEGALIRISAFSSLTNQPISLDMARRVLLNLNEKKKEAIPLENVLKVVAKHYNVSVNDLRSKKRQKDIAQVRQVACFLMKKLTSSSLQSIGSFIGGRDHSTVTHAITKIESLHKVDMGFAQKIKMIEQEILVN